MDIHIAARNANIAEAKKDAALAVLLLVELGELVWRRGEPEVARYIWEEAGDFYGRAQRLI